MNTAVNPKKEISQDPEPELQNKTTPDPGTILNNKYSVELTTGEAVIDLLNDPGFQNNWEALLGACPWATVFQSQPFIAAWYQVYRRQHLPILVIAMERGQLKGALPMVLLNTPADSAPGDNKGGKITGAGHYDAQYQAWLATPAGIGAFIKKALAEVMKQFPGHPISFRFLPSGVPLNWLKENKQWRQRSILQLHRRPLINFNAPEHAKELYGRKHFKNKINRLKKLGPVQFETIRELETFKSLLNEMAVMYDFRQSALFNKNPFHEDPEKKDFLVELFCLNLLHTTVLKVNEKTMAAVVAVTGKEGWVHLAGINCHSPVNARFYSPGFMHFVLLFKQLAEEGVHYFDLTPGYDAYKEELANGHDDVKELVISSKRMFILKRRIKKWIHARLVAANIRPMTVELALKRYSYLLRRRSVLSVVKGLAKRFHKKREQQLYQVQSYTLPAAIKISLHKDNLRDLMQFESGKRADVTRWEFLSDAVYRLERGQHSYTWTENGRLLCCAWFSSPDNLSTDKENNQTVDNTIVMQGYYCHAAAKDRLADYLKCVIDSVVNNEKKNYFLSADVLFCEELELARSV